MKYAWKKIFNRKKYNLSIFWVEKVFIQYKKGRDHILNWFHIIDYSRRIYNIPMLSKLAGKNNT